MGTREWTKSTDFTVFRGPAPAFPQVAGRTPPLKMPPSAETANTLEESGKTNKQRTEEANRKKSFWDRWF